MLSSEECDEIFTQLVQMLISAGREAIVEEVKAQITDLDAIPARKWIEAEEHFRPQPKQTNGKQKKHDSKQPHLPNMGPDVEETLQDIPFSLEDLADGTLSAYFYPPREKLLLLLQVIEATLSVPIIIGITTLQLFEQKTIRFNATSREEVSFTLSSYDLQEQEQNARDLLHLIEQIRSFID